MLVVAGGHSRNIGKTSVVCGIIRALPEFEWTAVKITQYGHGVCSHEGEPCECADPRHPVALSEEQGKSLTSDSGRFEAAGARRSFWLRTPAGQLGEAMPRLRRIIADAPNVIIESNSVLQFLHPDFCLMVLDGAVTDFKASSRRFLDRADALVTTSPAPLAWPEVPAQLIAQMAARKERFSAHAPCYVSPELVEAIRRAALRAPRKTADINR
jgi:hypothetical protein